MVDQVELYRKQLIENDPTRVDDILATTSFIEEEHVINEKKKKK